MQDAAATLESCSARMYIDEPSAKKPPEMASAAGSDCRNRRIAPSRYSQAIHSSSATPMPRPRVALKVHGSTCGNQRAKTPLRLQKKVAPATSSRPREASSRMASRRG